MKPDALRIDRLLWFLRLAPSRSVAQSWVETGHIRVSGQRVTKTSHPVRAGDVLTMPIRDSVRVIAILTLPDRRGPAAEAAAHYRDLTAPHTASASESDSQQGDGIDERRVADLGTRSSY